MGVLGVVICSCNSCKDKVDKMNVYEGCCDTAPVVMDFNPGKVYIPNIFTPNQDGKNDYFIIYADSGIVEIEELKIFDTDSILLYQYYMVPSGIMHSYHYAWYPYEDGMATYQGKFNYYFKIRNTKGERFELEGSACSYVCDEANPFDDFSNCGFRAQIDSNWQFDPNMPNLEPGCQ